MLLSDRDILAEVAAGRVVVDPWDAELVQPSSVDVRLDRYFRAFNNSQYTHTDPGMQQDDLTTLVEPKGDDPFVLHPGRICARLDVHRHAWPECLECGVNVIAR
jgi:dCTP deaminase